MLENLNKFQVHNILNLNFLTPIIRIIIIKYDCLLLCSLILIPYSIN